MPFLSSLGSTVFVFAALDLILPLSILVRATLPPLVAWRSASVLSLLVLALASTASLRFVAGDDRVKRNGSYLATAGEPDAARAPLPGACPRG